MAIENIKIPSIERGRVIIRVAHEDGYLSFLYPPVGPHTYNDAGKMILSRKQLLPNGDQMASFMHAFCCTDLKNEPEAFYLKGLLQPNRLIWVFNENVWTKDGVYVVHDPKAQALANKSSPKELDKILKNGETIEKVLFSEDGRVRFAKTGTYSSGERISKSFSKDTYAIATFGVEGAKKMQEVAIDRGLHTLIRPELPNNNGSPRHTVTALGVYDHSGHIGLASHRNMYSKSHMAFGILKE